ncbi:MAG TPA: dihydrofolate reductase family protein [Solirubrobacteraceae bacterium]|nr:dihydrofolate reductase family protein [Solirubrobacteraceae bacterium]
MRKLIYSMTVSLDGFIAGPGGDITWSAPDRELHLFHNREVRELGVQLCGRRLYETMLYWETPEAWAGDPEHVEFAEIWRATPKIVFSRTLQAPEGNYTLAERDIAEEVARLRREPGKDIAVGGATLAADCARLNLIDEYRLFISPIVLGSGTPYFPPLDEPIELELIETKRFGSRVVYVRYRRP